MRGLFVGHGPAMAARAPVAEPAGGALLATGLLTPVAGSVLTGTMATAIRKVHAPKGLWSTQGGYEYNHTLIAAIFAVVDTGPGPLSLDRALGIERSGLAVALAQLAAGLAGSAAVVALGERAPEPEPYRPRFVERAEAAREKHDGEPANR